MASPDRARARAVVRRLRRAYPRGHAARPEPVRRDPLDELILTVLSQNTNDVNRDRAWSSMRTRFPDWNAVLAARPRALADSIRVGGLADTKAPRIRAILREVLRREGRLSLARLRRMSSEDARAYLVSLPGIGGKTAACVLAFSLGRPVLPVDTHVARISARLGFASSRDPADRIQAALEALVPPADRLEAHVSLIAHGRTTCRALRPACRTCPLLDLCPSGGVGTVASS